ncbi:MAG: class II glutamine amidotransferase [Candidatus Lokiarchaeota archaeon]|nr:class II glutamine amidotransferase [Candidatus Lokiarchaeota archaeon]
MCELLALNFGMETSLQITFRGFQKRGSCNPDGWGLAYYPDESAIIIKEPITSTQSKLATFVSKYSEIRGKIFIGHVRKASVGNKGCFKNTHPFTRELDGKQFVFAHNGTLRNHDSLSSQYFTPIGDTDSEHSFCHLLSEYKDKIGSIQKREHFDCIHSILKAINERGNFNCIFSNGEYLFCYHDRDKYKGLDFVERIAPFGHVELVDDDWKVNLDEEKDTNQHGYVIATKPLTKEVWKSFESGELIVLRNGLMVYSSHRTSLEMRILQTIRNHPTKIEIQELVSKLKRPFDVICRQVQVLHHHDLIRQDSRDQVSADHKNASFFTNSGMNGIISCWVGKRDINN